MMIEALIKYIEDQYIEDQGLTIQVVAGALHISKAHKDGKELVLCWAISPLDLQYLPQEVLFEEADKKIEEFYQVYNQADEVK